MIKYSQDVIKVLKLSELEAYNLSHPYVGTEHLILGILSHNNAINDVLSNMNITYNNFKNYIINNITINSKMKYICYTPLLKKILRSSINDSKVTLKNIMLELLENNEGIGLSILNKLNVDILKLYNCIKENDLTLSIGEVLNNKEINTELIGRENELNKIIEILNKKEKCNPLLIVKLVLVKQP